MRNAAEGCRSNVNSEVRKWKSSLKNNFNSLCDCVDSCVGRSICGTPGNWSRESPWCFGWLLGILSSCWIALPRLNAWGGAKSYSSLIGHASEAQGRPDPLWVNREEGWLWGAGGGAGAGGNWRRWGKGRCGQDVK